MKDFFVSYNKADRSWAEWIAWQLEEADYTTLLQEWDFRPGCNFVLEMQNASDTCSRTVAILSPQYLGAQFTQPEWAAAFAADPQGWGRKLVPVKVRDCIPTGMLAQVFHIDLVGLEETQAKQQLLLGVQSGRAKPPKSPAYPAQPRHIAPAEPSFPGQQILLMCSQTSPPGIASSLAPFQRVYLFAVEKMYKSRYEAEAFAEKWLAEHPGKNFAAFEDAYSFAVNKMYKSRGEAEAFAFGRID